MRTNLFSFILITAALIGIHSCQTPEEVIEIADRNGLISISASFPNEQSPENNFQGEIDHVNKLITIVFPYNFPRLSENVLPDEALKKVKIKAKLENNVYIDPPLGYVDLTTESTINLRDDAANTVKKYTVKSEIRKNNESKILSFRIPSKGLTGVINDNDYTISLVSLENIGIQEAEVDISHGATCSPDPQVETLNYDQDQKIRVIAQNGIDFTEYTIIKNIPGKIPFGIRPNSGRLVWAKKLSEVGVTSRDKITSMSVLDNHIVLNERGVGSAIYLDKKTGEYAGSMNIGVAVNGDFSNYFMTSDEKNNILISNYTPNDSDVFTVWRTNGINGQLVKYIEYNAVLVGKEALGWSLSLQGNLDENAIITTPVFFKGEVAQFARWQVIDGVLQSQTPSFVELNVLQTNNWTIGVDVVYSSSSDVNSDFYVGTYTRHIDGNRYFLRFSGANNSVVASYHQVNSINAFMSAVDYTEFNNSSYVAHTVVNPMTFPVSGSDLVYLYDQSARSLVNSIQVCPQAIYGGLANDGTNKDRRSDVVLRVSDDGFYLNVYFMFANGYIVHTQYDCIDI